GEPGPLVVRDPHRDPDVDVLDDVGDLAEVSAPVTAATVAGHGLGRLLGHALGAAGEAAAHGLDQPGGAHIAGDLLADLAYRPGGLLDHLLADVLAHVPQLGGHRSQRPLAGHLQQFP